MRCWTQKNLNESPPGPWAGGGGFTRKPARDPGFVDILDVIAKLPKIAALAQGAAGVHRRHSPPPGHMPCLPFLPDIPITYSAPIPPFRPC